MLGGIDIVTRLYAAHRAFSSVQMVVLSAFRATWSGLVRPHRLNKFHCFSPSFYLSQSFDRCLWYHTPLRRTYPIVMASSILCLLPVALMVCYAASQAYGEVTQPGLNPIQLLPEFSMEPSEWPHGTPLLQAHWQAEHPPIAGRQAIKSWFGWKNVKYIFSLYVANSARRPID